MAAETISATDPYLKFGLIAGEGNSPIIVAKEAAAANKEVYTFAFKGITSSEIEKYSKKTFWVKFGNFEKTMSLFKENELKNLIMIGRFNHVLVFSLSLFDGWSRDILRKLRSKDPKSIKNKIYDLFEKEKINCLDPTPFLQECIPHPGILTKNRKPTENEMKEIKYGFPIARKIADMEIGQSIAVKDGVVIAVEGIEGTNNLIKRAGDLTNGGCIIIKSSRPNQDKRFDIPTIGDTTLSKMAAAKCTCIAITAGDTVFHDMEKSVKFAEKNNIAIIAVNPKDYL